MVIVEGSINTKVNNNIKHFYCCTQELCVGKNEWATNKRCFANYLVRSSCPNLMRKDSKSWKQGSKENDEFCKIGA